MSVAYHPSVKKCQRRKQTLLVKHFSTRGNTYQSMCKPCRNAYQKELRDQKKAEILQPGAAIYPAAYNLEQRSILMRLNVAASNNMRYPARNINLVQAERLFQDGLIRIDDGLAQLTNAGIQSVPGILKHKSHYFERSR